MGNMRELMVKLGPDAERVQVLFVTVDPGVIRRNFWRNTFPRREAGAKTTGSLKR